MFPSRGAAVGASVVQQSERPCCLRHCSKGAEAVEVDEIMARRRCADISSHPFHVLASHARDLGRRYGPYELAEVPIPPGSICSVLSTKAESFDPLYTGPVFHSRFPSSQPLERRPIQVGRTGSYLQAPSSVVVEGAKDSSSSDWQMAKCTVQVPFEELGCTSWLDKRGRARPMPPLRETEKETPKAEACSYWMDRYDHRWRD